MVEAHFSQMQKSIDSYYTATAWLYNLCMKVEERPSARALLFALLDLEQGETIVEIGAGTGKNMQYYPEGVKVTLLDRNPAMLRRARKKAKHTPHNFVLADAKQLPFDDNSIDVSVLTYALSGIPGNTYVLEEAKRVVRPGGLIGVLDFDNIPNSTLGGMVRLHLANSIARCGNEVLYHRAFTDGRKLPQSIYVLQG